MKNIDNIDQQNGAVKHLVFNGGGINGVKYSGVIEALEGDISPEVKTVSGSSDGALFAALLATGVKSENLKKIIDKNNFSKLSSEEWINKGGEPLYDILNREIKSSILAALYEDEELKKLRDSVAFLNVQSQISGLAKNDSTNQNAKYNQLQLQSIESIQNRCNNSRDKITFGDLEILHKLNPKKFKDLKVYAFNNQDAQTKSFDFKQTPDVDIVSACQASVSLPTPVKINGVEYIRGNDIKDFQDHTNAMIFGFNQGKDHISEDVRENSKNNTVELKAKIITINDSKKALTRGEQIGLHGYYDTKDFLITHKNAEPEENYELCKLFLNVFDKWEETKKWYSTRDTSPKKSEKAQDLLDFAVHKNYTQIDSKQLITNYIKKAAYNRNSNTFDRNTTAIEKLIETLNKEDISSSIKEAFFAALNIEQKMQFEKGDFKVFLKNQIEADKHAKELYRTENFGTEVRHLIFSGGGAKGVMYPGVVQALEENSITNKVGTVAGSSAGALVAAFLAVGIEAKDLKELLDGQNFKDLLGKGLINRDGKPLYDLMDRGIKTSILKALDNSENMINLKNNTQKSEKDQVLYDQICIIQSKCSTDSEITFGDLKILHDLDYEKFKDLKVTAVEKSSGNMKVFDWEKDANVGIAKACRASASLPILLAPVEINGVKYVDGGYRDNMPTKHLKESFKHIEQKSKAMVFGFSEGDDNTSPLFNALYSEKKELDNSSWFSKLKNKFLANVLAKKLFGIGGDYTHTGKEEKKLEELQENFQTRVVELKAGNTVGTTDFGKSQTHSKQMELQGYYDTKSFLLNYNIVGELDEAKQINHEFGKFFLEVFKEWEQTDKWYSLTSRDPAKSIKAKKLLDFADPEKNQSKDITDQIKEYIRYIALDRSSEKMGVNTTSMTKLIEKLNATDTPGVIKEEFAKVIDIKEKDNNKINFTKNSIKDYLDKLEGSKQKFIKQPQTSYVNRSIANNSKKPSGPSRW